ncbi:hypothetical protein BDQ17DRAFT_1362597 [Cyathus striatus]|nr:hypothetical protein BDQ17DRAFT_1362597 [Cyathus striatus]
MIFQISNKVTEVTFSSVNINQNRSNSATLYLGAILFTGRISMAYDGVTEEIFKVFTYLYSFLHPVIIIPDASKKYRTLVQHIDQHTAGIILQLILFYKIFVISTSIIFSIIISFSCFIFGFTTLIAVGVMGEMLLPTPVVTAGIMVGEN